MGLAAGRTGTLAAAAGRRSLFDTGPDMRLWLRVDRIART